MSFCVENLTNYLTAMSRITRARAATAATEKDSGDASGDQLRQSASVSRSNLDQRVAAMTTDNKLFPSKCSRAREATAGTAATEKDSGDASGDQPRLPASVSRSNLDHRVAAMTAAGNNMPIDTPYGQKTVRMKLLNEELAEFRSPQCPNGLCASENFICHSTTGLVVIELAAESPRLERAAHHGRQHAGLQRGPERRVPGCAARPR